MLTIALAASVLGAAASSLADDQARAAEPIPYDCRDLVVIARFENLDYDPVDDEADMIGQGWMTSRLHVGEVVAGRPETGELILRYFGHTYFRSDHDFLLVVHPANDGNFIRRARMIEGNVRPRLARRCTTIRNLRQPPSN